MPVTKRECRRCGKSVATTSSGGLIAHACKHGTPCVLSFKARMRGDRVARCTECLAGCQLLLFPDVQ